MRGRRRRRHGDRNLAVPWRLHAVWARTPSGALGVESVAGRLPLWLSHRGRTWRQRARGRARPHRRTARSAYGSPLATPPTAGKRQKTLAAPGAAQGRPTDRAVNKRVQRRAGFHCKARILHARPLICMSGSVHRAKAKVVRHSSSGTTEHGHGSYQMFPRRRRRPHRRPALAAGTARRPASAAAGRLPRRCERHGRSSHLSVGLVWLAVGMATQFFFLGKLVSTVCTRTPGGPGRRALPVEVGEGRQVAVKRVQQLRGLLNGHGPIQASQHVQMHCPQLAIASPANQRGRGPHAGACIRMALLCVDHGGAGYNAYRAPRHSRSQRAAWSVLHKPSKQPPRAISPEGAPEGRVGGRAAPAASQTAAHRRWRRTSPGRCHRT